MTKNNRKRRSLPNYEVALATWDGCEKTLGLRLDRGPTSRAVANALEAQQIVSSMSREDCAICMALLRRMRKT